MAKGHLYLVLTVTVLLGAGPVLAINVDLREQELETQQELKFAASGEVGDVVDQAELDPYESDLSRVESRLRNKKCQEIGGVCKRRGACEFQEAPFDCSSRHKCCLPPRSCIFGDTAWPHDYSLTEACLELVCNDGTWEYTGNFDKACGTCTFGGEPIVYTFDPLISAGLPPNNPNYWTGVNGEFVMAQPKFETHAEYYVTSHFGATDCGISCVEGVTYHELGMTIKMILPLLSNPSDEIKVLVNEDPVTIGNTVKYYYGTLGPVMVFKHNHIMSPDNVNCIGVVGTTGITVALCERDPGFIGFPWLPGGLPWAYILAHKSLKSIPSTLQGLCQTWTGHDQDCFTKRDETCVNNWWDSSYVLNGNPTNGFLDGGPVIHEALPTSWAMTTPELGDDKK